MYVYICKEAFGFIYPDHMSLVLTGRHETQYQIEKLQLAVHTTTAHTEWRPAMQRSVSNTSGGPAEMVRNLLPREKDRFGPPRLVPHVRQMYEDGAKKRKGPPRREYRNHQSFFTGDG